MRRPSRTGRFRTILRLTALASAVSLLPACWWAQPGAGPQHSRFNPWENELTTDNVAQLQHEWTVELPGSSTEPITDGEHLYLLGAVDGPGVRALDLASGATAWQTAVPQADSGPILVDGDVMVAASMARHPFVDPDQCADITVLDAGSGDVLNTQEIYRPVSGFVTAGSIVAYVKSESCLTGSERLAVLDRDTLVEQWTADVTADASPPTVSANRLLLNSNGTVKAFDASGCGAATCLPLWTAPDVSNAYRSVVAAEGRVFVYRFEAPWVTDTTWNEYADLRMLDADSGEELWQTRYGPTWSPGIEGAYGGIQAIAVANDQLYVSGYENEGSGTPRQYRLDAYAISDCADGACAPNWTAALHDSSAYGSVAGRVAVAGGVVYVTGDHALKAYDAAGCGAPTCAPLVTIPLSVDEIDHLVVSAGRVIVTGTYTDGGGAITSFRAL